MGARIWMNNKVDINLQGVEKSKTDQCVVYYCVKGIYSETPLKKN